MTDPLKHRWKIGDRARFTGRDTTFGHGPREGKVGTVVTDATLDFNGSNFGVYPPLSEGTCGWRLDGQEEVYITGLADLTPESRAEDRQ